MAAMLLNSGEADVMLVVGGESAHCPIIMSTLAQAKALSKNTDPKSACRPFDADRDGFVMGEGGGAIVLETEEHAKTEGQTEIKNQAEAETSRAAEDQNTVSLEKGSFIDQVVDDQTAAHEEHQK